MAARKVARITEGNRQAERANAALFRELAELREERAMMIHMFTEQLNEARRSAAEQKEAEEAQAAAAVLENPADEAAAAAEVGQLEEELRRAKLAGVRRLEQKTQEVDSLRRELEERGEQLGRLCRASQAIDASADADLNELSSRRGAAEKLDAEIEELEACCLKMHCQIDAWGVRLREARRQAAEASAAAASQEKELCSRRDAFQLAATGLQEQVGRANALCEQLKCQLAGFSAESSKEGISGNSPSPAPSSQTGSPALSRTERGVQTRYITEQTRLRQQVETLTQELERVSASKTGGAQAGAAGGWLSINCLRPRFEDPASQPPAAAALRDVQRERSSTHAT
mmetsp:Transcript_7705/g.14569  ORF Transcript_7705/g.14569 Transcript_7705/m.14569 type:complete len:344 (+) Transcript_7705:88-1119(+)